MRLTKNNFIFPVEDKVEKVEDDFVKKRNFQQDKYIAFLKKFINDRCEFDYQRLTHINEIKTKYAKYIEDNSDEVKLYDVNFGLTPKDICKLDNKYEFKYLNVCKFCKKKFFTNCCLDSNRKHRTKQTFILNLKVN